MTDIQTIKHTCQTGADVIYSGDAHCPRCRIIKARYDAGIPIFPILGDRPNYQWRYLLATWGVAIGIGMVLGGLLSIEEEHQRAIPILLIGLGLVVPLLKVIWNKEEA